MTRARITSLVFAGIIGFGLFGVGCSSDTSPAPADAGKKDTGSATGGKGGSSGAGGSATGGANGTGGSSGTGGAKATGGSNGTGGSNATGGSAGAAGSGSGGSAGAVGGAAGGNSGGSAGSGSGGSAGNGGGTGGTSAVDAGNLDGGGNDAVDAPLPNPDGPMNLDSDSVDTITPVLLDSAIDQGSVDVEAVDTTVVRLDAEESIDAESLDVISPQLDSSDDSNNPVHCPSVPIVSIENGGGKTYQPNTVDAFCFATCDVINGWGCGQFGDRHVYVNGQLMANCSSPALPDKVSGKYYIFQVSAGSDQSAFITWWGTAASAGTCTAPEGGFGLN